MIIPLWIIAVCLVVRTYVDVVRFGRSYVYGVRNKRREPRHDADLPVDWIAGQASSFKADGLPPSVRHSPSPKDSGARR